MDHVALPIPGKTCSAAAASGLLVAMAGPTTLDTVVWTMSLPVRFGGLQMVESEANKIEGFTMLGLENG